MWKGSSHIDCWDILIANNKERKDAKTLISCNTYNPSRALYSSTFWINFCYQCFHGTKMCVYSPTQWTFWGFTTSFLRWNFTMRQIDVMRDLRDKQIEKSKQRAKKTSLHEQGWDSSRKLSGWHDLNENQVILYKAKSWIITEKTTDIHNKEGEEKKEEEKKKGKGE